MADNDNNDNANIEAEAVQTAPEKTERADWVALYGALEDAQGAPMKGILLAQEVCDDEQRAREIAEARGGRAVPATDARFASVPVVPRDRPEAARLGEDGPSRKEVASALASYGEAREAGERSWIDDGKTRAVVYVERTRSPRPPRSRRSAPSPPSRSLPPAFSRSSRRRHPRPNPSQPRRPSSRATACAR